VVSAVLWTVTGWGCTLKRDQYYLSGVYVVPIYCLSWVCLEPCTMSSAVCVIACSVLCVSVYTAYHGLSVITLW